MSLMSQHRTVDVKMRITVPRQVVEEWNLKPRDEVKVTYISGSHTFEVAKS